MHLSALHIALKDKPHFSSWIMEHIVILLIYYSLINAIKIQNENN